MMSTITHHRHRQPLLNKTDNALAMNVTTNVYCTRCNGINSDKKRRNKALYYRNKFVATKDHVHFTNEKIKNICVIAPRHFD